MAEFVMPSLGADMDAGTIVEWRVRPGDTVHRGDIVAVVDTDKSDIEVEVFDDGVVEELLVEPGCQVGVGTPLARIAPAPAEVPPEPAAPTPEPATTTPEPATASLTPEPAAATPEPAAVTPEPATATAAPEPAGARTAGRVRASPLARRRAAARHIDLGSVPGSGPGGAVLAGDLPAGAPAAPAPAPGPRDRRESLRRATGELMARSARDIPHYHLATTIDLAAAGAWLADENARRPATRRLLPAALLLRATALAARDHPAVNGHWDGGFRPAAAVHLGVAVSLRGGGLVAPAIADADRLGVDELMAALRDLVTRARAGRVRASEVAGATLTVTNLGDRGAEEVHGVIYPPQVALVGFGRITERPWARDGLLGVGPTVRATLAGDHRVSDGHEGSRFLFAVDRLLQAPDRL